RSRGALRRNERCWRDAIPIGSVVRDRSEARDLDAAACLTPDEQPAALGGRRGAGPGAQVGKGLVRQDEHVFRCCKSMRNNQVTGTGERVNAATASRGNGRFSAPSW